MKRLLIVLALLAAACSDDPTDAGRSDWLHVLHRKKAAAAPQASAQARQVYADTLSAFVKKHPSHGRAREVYQHIQLDFARELASLGRYQDAIRFYRAVLEHDPENQQALAGVRDAADHLSVSRAKLLALEKGMSQRDVAAILGKPIPGWKQKARRRDSTIEAWYYRTVEGTVAGVYFRDGELFAAEAASNAKLSPL
jgi:tetratricopeptide (TPR) repeat protein